MNFNLVKATLFPGILESLPEIMMKYTDTTFLFNPVLPFYTP